MKRETFIPIICTHQHMLAWNLCCKFPCFIFYYIKYNWRLSFSFHVYRVNFMFCFLKVTVLGSTETLACVVHVYYLSFCCLPLWTFASETPYLLVTLHLFIFSVWLLSIIFKLAYICAWSHLDFFFFNRTLKKLTITDADAVFSLSALLVTFRYCMPWFGWAETNLVLFIWVEDNPLYLNAIFRDTLVNMALKMIVTGQFVLSFNVYCGAE